MLGGLVSNAPWTIKGLLGLKTHDLKKVVVSCFLTRVWLQVAPGPRNVPVKAKQEGRSGCSSHGTASGGAKVTSEGKQH